MGGSSAWEDGVQLILNKVAFPIKGSGSQSVVQIEPALTFEVQMGSIPHITSKSSVAAVIPPVFHGSRLDCGIGLSLETLAKHQLVQKIACRLLNWE